MDKLLKKKPDIIVYIPFVGSFYSDYNYEKLKYFFDFKIIPEVYNSLGMDEFRREKIFFKDAIVSSASYFYKYRVSLKNITINQEF